MIETVEDPILTILKTSKFLSFNAIQQETNLSERKLKYRLNQLVKEEKINKYPSLKDTRTYLFAITEQYPDNDYLFDKYPPISKKLEEH